MFYLATFCHEISAHISIFYVHFNYHSLPFRTGVDIDIDLERIDEIRQLFHTVLSDTHQVIAHILAAQIFSSLDILLKFR